MHFILATIQVAIMPPPLSIPSQTKRPTSAALSIRSSTSSTASSDQSKSGKDKVEYDSDQFSDPDDSDFDSGNDSSSDDDGDNLDLNVKEDSKVVLLGIKLLESPYPSRPSTIYFDYPKSFPFTRARVEENNRLKTSQNCYQEEKSNSNESESNVTISSAKASFHIGEDVCAYNCVIDTLMRNGLVQSSSAGTATLRWSKPLTQEAFFQINGHQRINHFPCSTMIGRKDHLIRALNHMKRQNPSLYSFYPDTWTLPLDRALYDTRCTHASATNGSSLYIMKPVNSSCGRGIKIVTPNSIIPRRKKCVISRYISNPLLINNKKFDLRLYVMVTSFTPLRIYLFENGLARFCTVDYSNDRDCIGQRFRHLTNYSVNKKNILFEKNTSATADDVGSKWSIRALKTYISRQYGHLTWEEIWMQIEDIAVRTILSMESSCVSALIRKGGRANCFELFGFDVLIDDNMKCWLLEVNILPSLSSSSPFDRFIKTQLMTDIFHCVGITLPKSKSAQIPIRTDVKEDRNRIQHLQACKHMSNYPYNESDLAILRETAEEYNRRGHFHRLYPNTTIFTRSSHIFETPRYENVLVQRFMTELTKSEQNRFLMGSSVPSSVKTPISVKRSSQAISTLSMMKLKLSNVSTSPSLSSSRNTSVNTSRNASSTNTASKNTGSQKGTPSESLCPSSMNTCRKEISSFSEIHPSPSSKPSSRPLSSPREGAETPIARVIPLKSFAFPMRFKSHLAEISASLPTEAATRFIPTETYTRFLPSRSIYRASI